jgi:hypothetical protein
MNPKLKTCPERSRRTENLKFLLLIGALLFALGSSADAEPAGNPPSLIDAHSHAMMINRAVPNPDDEIQLFKRVSLSGVVLISTNFQLLKDLSARHPGFIFPFINLAREDGLKVLPLNETRVQQITMALDSGACGVGELPLRTFHREKTSSEGEEVALDHPILAKIYELAAQRSVPVMMHVNLEDDSTVEEFKRMLAAHPKTTFILAHAGTPARASLVGELMTTHANLQADLSGRLDPVGRVRIPPAMAAYVSANRITESGDRLKDEWRNLLERFPDRFLFGLDLGPPVERHVYIEDLVKRFRTVLSQLAPRDAERIGSGNIKQLLRNCRVMTQ